jgi:competence protein ComEC
LGLLWLFAPRGIPNRALGVILNLPLLFPIAAKLNAGEAVVTMLDVGQGLSVSVQTQHHSLLFDTGAKFLGGGDMGKNVILPFLNYQNIKKLDMLVISHGDNDHIGGADTILKNLPVEQILTSVPEKFDGRAATYCNAPQSWNWDGVTFNLISPIEKFDDENNNSCVLKIQTSAGSVLLTGDIEAKAEKSLVNNVIEQLPATILVAPHHGSKTSSTQPFIKAVHPEAILIPNGYRNQFKHPSKEVIARYRDLHIPYLTSANDGAITVSLKNDHLKIESLRGTDGKYWNFQHEN